MDASDIALTLGAAPDPPPPALPVLGGAKGSLSSSDAPAILPSVSSARATFRAEAAAPAALPTPSRPRTASTAGLMPYTSVDSAAASLVSRRLRLGSRITAGLSRGDRCCLCVGGLCSLRLALGLALGGLTALLWLQEGALRSPAFWQNPAGVWLAWAAILVWADLLLGRLELGLWAQVRAVEQWLEAREAALRKRRSAERSGALSRTLVHALLEGRVYWRCAEGRLAHICLPVIALALAAQGSAFPLRLSPDAASLYTSICTVALCVACGLVLKNFALALACTALEMRALGHRVNNCLIAEELLCFLSAAQVCMGEGDAPSDLCALIPSFYLLSAHSWHLSSRRIKAEDIECFHCVAAEGGLSTRDRVNTLGEPLEGGATPSGGGGGGGGGSSASLLTASGSACDILDLRGLCSVEDVQAAMGRVFDCIVDRRDERRYFVRAARAALAPARRSAGSAGSAGSSAPPAPTPSAPGSASGAADRVTAHARHPLLLSVKEDYYRAAVISKEDLVQGLWREDGAGGAAQPGAWFPGGREDVDLCWKVLESNGGSTSAAHSETLSREQFQHACTFLFESWQSLKASLRATHGVSSAVAMVTEMLFWIAQFLLALGIFRVDFSAVLLPLLTLTVSLSFGLGPLLQRFLDSLMFTLVINPYAPGDTVQIDSGPPMRVHALNLLTTEFVVKSSNLSCVRRNSDLLASSIVNQTRSASAQFTLPFALDQGVTAAQVGEVQCRMAEYLARHPIHWEDTVTLSVAPADALAAAAPARRVDFSLCVTSRATWADAGKAYAAHTALVMHLLALLRHLGLEHSAGAGVWVPAAGGGRWH